MIISLFTSNKNDTTFYWSVNKNNHSAVFLYLCRSYISVKSSQKLVFCKVYLN